MRAVLTIARNTFKEAIRDKILYMFLGFAILMIVSSKLVSMLTVGDETKIIIDVGLSSMQLFGMLIAVMMSVMMVSREFEQRTIFTILTKPVNRFQYLVGKYAGLYMIILSMLAMMTLALILITLIFTMSFEPGIFIGFFGTALEMSILCAFAVFFATITKPILGSILTLASFVVGHLTNAFWLLKDRLNDPVSEILLPVFYYIFPNLEVFNFKTEIVHHIQIPIPGLFWAVVYSIFYTAIVLLLAWLQFENKDIE